MTEKLETEKIERVRAQKELESLKRQMEFILGATKTGIDILDSEFNIRYVDPEWRKIYGDPTGKKCYKYFKGRDKVCPNCTVLRALATKQTIVTEQSLPMENNRPIQATSTPFQNEDGEWLVAEVNVDITELKRSEREHRTILRLHESTLATMPSSLLVLDKDLNVLMANRQYLKECGLSSSDAVGKNITALFPADLLAEQSFLERMKHVAANGGSDTLSNVVHISNDHHKKHLDIRICGVHSPEHIEGEARLIVLIEDRTEHRQLEEQLQQRAKLESVGQLAGGVAHDFNNLLTGITGYAQLALSELSPESAAYSDITEIRNLADHAANLTHQLLAFSRRQPLQPVVLNVNNLVKETTKMLSRLIGEDIDLALFPASDLGNTRVDLSQFEQVLMNLAVNARDAMPQGGKLTIETSNVTLGQDYADRHPGVTPGEYIMLAVTDTGHGMDEETQKHIFEPFFTTKELGKGTGLGLATTYGIIKQHGGNIWVYSEPEQGTTFKIFLPRIDDTAQVLDEKPEKNGSPHGTESILILEDELAVRKVAERVLKKQGYTVFSATSPKEAEIICDREADNIALMLTDIVLPERNGKETYQQLKSDHPHLKVLFMSGYTANAVIHHGELDIKAPYIQKPFEPKDLARKVREVLDSPKE